MDTAIVINFSKETPVEFRTAVSTFPSGEMLGLVKLVTLFHFGRLLDTICGMKKLLLSALICVGALATPVDIRYLHPRELPGVPEGPKRVLEADGCLIPQVYSRSDAHNFLHGEFSRSGQMDWAFLCSKNGESTLWVIWSGGGCLSRTASAKDETFLQSIGDGKKGFSRMISIVEAKRLEKTLLTEKQINTVKFEHQGINDAFLDKGSSIRYCINGKWQQFSGSD